MLVAPRQLLAPRLLGLHVLAALATMAAVLLGLWQYHAWQTRRDDQSASLAQAPAKPLLAVMAPDDPFPGDAVGQSVVLSGRWLPGSTVYVADRDLHGRRGVWAVTPVAVCRGSDTPSCRTAPAMLVVRGWAAGVRTAPPAPTGPVEVTGWLQPGEGSGSSDPHPTDDVLPDLRIADAIQHVHQDLFGGYVIARVVSTGSTGAGLLPVTPASLPRAQTFTALRNLLYALEWWVFAGFAVFIWWRWCRDELERRRMVDEAVGDAGQDAGQDPGQDAGQDAADDRPGDSGGPEVSGVTGVRSSP